MKVSLANDFTPAHQRFQPNDEVRIRWEMAYSNGSFAQYGHVGPLKVKYFLGPMGLSLRSYMVSDARGVTDVVDERVLEHA